MITVIVLIGTGSIGQAIARQPDAAALRTRSEPLATFSWMAESRQPTGMENSHQSD